MFLPRSDRLSRFISFLIPLFELICFDELLACFQRYSIEKLACKVIINWSFTPEVKTVNETVDVWSSNYVSRKTVSPYRSGAKIYFHIPPIFRHLMVMDSTLERYFMMTLHPHSPISWFSFKHISDCFWFHFPFALSLILMLFLLPSSAAFFFFKSLPSPVYIVDLVHCVQGF